MFKTPSTSVGGNGGGVPLTTTTTSAQSPKPSDTGDQSHRRSSSSRAIQFHPAKPAIIDLFNLYLGRNGRHKSDDSIREPPNKAQKRVIALNRDIHIPPCDGQFLSDFELLQNQFPDHEQLRTVLESVLVSLVIQCSNHAPRSEFLLFALRSLYSIGYIHWDSFLPSLLSSVTSAEMSHIQSPNPEPSLISVHGIGSPSQSANETSFTALSPSKSSTKDYQITSLRKLSCQIILHAMDTNLKPSTHADVFHHMMKWLVTLDHKSSFEWLHKCLNVVWMLVDENKCRVPFYELLRSGLQFMEDLPDDKSLFTLILEVHRRRDMMAMYMMMLDQHLHCPSFGSQRLLTHTAVNMSHESTSHPRYSPITYPSVLGEPLHGEDIAFAIQRGSVDWERAMRCIKHALCNTPSPDWWRRVLLLAPCHRSHSQGSTPGAVFSSDMICEATIDRIVELLKLTNSDVNCWQEWVIYSDLFFLLMKSGCIDFVDFLDKLVLCINKKENQEILKTNHVMWLLAQIIRIELVITTLSTDSRKVETTRKVLSFHRESRTPDPNNPQTTLLDYISSCQNLRIWSLNSSTREYLNTQQLHKGKQIDEWWRQVSKGGRMMDYMNLDERSIGMFWVVSYTMAQPACEMVMTWLTSAGHVELPNEKITVMREVNPVPVSLMSGFSINLCLKLALQMEDAMFYGQHAPNIAMVETYTRLLLIYPHSLFRSHLSHLHQRNPETFNKPAATLLVLEILNYRLFSLYRYQGKSKTLMYDITKILSTLKGKRGGHRVFRLAENLCMNLIMSLREFFFIRKEGKGPSELSETLNRATITTLAIIIKTRGIADVDHLLYLPTMLEQILTNSQHTWSNKTLSHFPPLLRDILSVRVDKRALAIQAWQQAEATVIHQCTQLLSPPDDPTYVMTYISHSFPQHKQYLCAGAWVLMRGHPDNINTKNLGRVIGEFSPEEVTANVYTLVDVILCNIQLDIKHGHSFQDVISNVCANLAHFIWIHELLPPDVLLLALIDRDDDPHALPIVVNLLETQELQQRINFYVANHGPPEHWGQTDIFNSTEFQKALGTHLSWKDRSPTYFDNIAARLLPVIPLIIYRLIENDLTDLADRVLQLHSSFLLYYPLHFTFVRDILAYFYGHLPRKLIIRILNILDTKKTPFSESFPQHINSSNTVSLDYFTSLLSNLVDNVIPPLPPTATNNQFKSNYNFKPRKPFYQNQDPGTHTQLVLETVVIEILSLPITPPQIISSFVNIISRLHFQPKFNHSNTPSLMIQACGILLSQLPVDFHIPLYADVARVIKESSCHMTGGYALLDPTWTCQENTSTALGNMVALVHALFSNLPQEWLDRTHLLLNELRPVSSVGVLRVAFRVIGPLLPRLANAHSLFTKTLEVLLNMMVDVFGRNNTHSSTSDITDLIDFLHHVVHYEGEGGSGPVQPSSKPKPDVLALCGKAIQNLHSDIQLLLSHLTTDVNFSIYETPIHPNPSQNPS